VKVTEAQHRASENAGPAAEVLQAKDDKPIEDEFEELDEEDALRLSKQWRDRVLLAKTDTVGVRRLLGFRIQQSRHTR